MWERGGDIATSRKNTISHMTAKELGACVANKKDGACISIQSFIGGSALPEGVMMRGRHVWAVAVRTANGSIHVEHHRLRLYIVGFFRRVPILRGCISLVESMLLSYEAMSIACDYAYDEKDKSWNDFLDSRRNRPLKADSIAEKATNLQDAPRLVGRQMNAVSRVRSISPDRLDMVFSVILGILLGVALFVVAPVMIAALFVEAGSSPSSLGFNSIEALVRVGILLVYVWSVGFNPDVLRVLGYHGAEHRVINCFESGAPLKVETVRSCSRLHPRCGTSFLLMAVLVSVVLNSMIPNGVWVGMANCPSWTRALMTVLLRLLMLPLVVGISYEISVRWAGRNSDSLLTKAILWPGLQLQRLTTRAPDDGMIECAIAAIERVLEVDSSTAP